MVTHIDSRGKFMLSSAFVCWMFWAYFVPFSMYCYYLISGDELSNYIDLLNVTYEVVSFFFIYIVLTTSFVSFVLYKIITSPSIASDGMYVYNGMNMNPIIRWDRVTHVNILQDSKKNSKKLVLITESKIPIKTPLVCNIDKFIEAVREEYSDELSHITESKRYSILVEDWLLIVSNIILLILTWMAGIFITKMYTIIIAQ